MIFYKVQTRKQGRRYETRLSTTNASQAELVYRGYNIGNGFAKRLLRNGKTIAQYSEIQNGK